MSAAIRAPLAATRAMHIRALRELPAAYESDLVRASVASRSSR
jgi:hypothetical protein